MHLQYKALKQRQHTVTFHINDARTHQLKKKLFLKQKAKFGGHLRRQKGTSQTNRSLRRRCTLSIGGWTNEIDFLR